MSKNNYEIGGQLSFFDEEELFKVPKTAEKETLYTNMNPEYFRNCEQYLRDVQYETADTSNGVTLLTDNSDKLSEELKRADRIISEITAMTEQGYTTEQIKSLHDLIVQSVDAGRDCLVRESVNTEFNEQQMNDMKTMIGISLHDNTKTNYKAIFTLRDKYVRDNQEEQERPEYLEFPDAEQLSVYPKEATLPANAVLIAEDEERNMQIFQSGRRFYLQQDSNTCEIAPLKVSHIFSEDNMSFAFTPDNLHVHYLDTEKGSTRIHERYMPLKEYQITEGMSCTMPVSGTGHDLTLIYNNHQSVTLQYNGKERTMPVEEDSEYVYQILKTKIKAKYGAEGLFSHMEHAAYVHQNGGYDGLGTLAYNDMSKLFEPEMIPRGTVLKDIQKPEPEMLTVRTDTPEHTVADIHDFLADYSEKGEADTICDWKAVKEAYEDILIDRNVPEQEIYADVVHQVLESLENQGTSKFVSLNPELLEKAVQSLEDMAEKHERIEQTK